MKTILYILLFTFSCIYAVQAQNTFEKTYGSSLFEEAQSVSQTPDGGYIIGGSNLVKIDDLGEVQWTKPYSSSFANTTSDQGYILVGGHSPTIIFTKVTTVGDTAWQSYYREGVWANRGSYIEQTQDSGYIVAGNFQSVTGSGMLLLKLNHQGKKLWRRTFTEATSAGFNHGFSVQQTTDKGFIITGYANINFYDSTRNKDVFIVKTDSLGREQWRRYYGGSKDDIGYFVKQDNVGNYFIAGTTNSYGNGTKSNMYLIKLDPMGDSLWTQTYGGNFDETAKGLWPTDDGGCILAGSSRSFTNGDIDGYIVKVDKDGNAGWTKNYGGTGAESFNFVQQTSDKGYIMAGYTDSKGAGDFDMYVLKTDSLGDIQLSTGIAENFISSTKCEVYPNPNSGVFSIKSKLIISTIKITNALGKTMHSGTVNAQQARLDLSQLSKGIYFYQINTVDHKILKSGKIIIR